MVDPVVQLLEEKGLAEAHVERAPEGHVRKIEARRADGQLITVIMDEARDDQHWVNAVWARADPEGFMASLAEDGGSD
jgi:hypothetical protein